MHKNKKKSQEQKFSENFGHYFSENIHFTTHKNENTEKFWTKNFF